jgi:signal transduction histidine kinase/ligand-binding sensor domain-containing protein/CheY-like chemotaxis protein
MLLFCINALAFDYSNLETEYFHISQWKVNNSFGKTVIGDVTYDEESGHIILATSDGVKSFDGIDFTNFYPFDSTPNNVSFAKIYLTQEHIWAANSHGVFMLGNNGVTKFEYSLNYNTYSNFAVYRNNSAWFVSDFKLYKITKNNSKAIYINDVKSTSMHISSDSNRIYIGSQGVVYELDNEGNVIDNILLENPELIVISMYLTIDEILLINTNNGVYKFNTKNKKMDSKPIPVIARMIFEDSTGRLWFGTNKGLILYVNKILKKVNISNNQDLRIRGIVEDRYGNIWFGTWGEGLFRLMQTPFDFLQTSVNPDSYIETSNNDKWIGGYNGLSIIHNNKEITPLVLGLKNHAVYDLEEGVNGNVWAAYKSDLVKFNAMANYPEIVPDIDALFYKFLQKDVNNNLWVGTEKGLFYKNLFSNNGFKQLILPNKENINTLILLQEKQILMLAEQNAYIYENGHFFQNKMTESLQNLNLVIAYDRTTNSIWYYSDKDNQIVKTNAEEIQKYKLNKVLNHFSFYSIEVTADNDLVLLGENGVIRIREEWVLDYTDKELLAFELLATPGLNKNECNGGHSSITMNSKSQIFFTCKSGVLSLNSKNQNPIKSPKPMKIDLRIADEKVEAKSVDLVFSPSKKSYHFTFGRESLNELMPLEYRYRLIGVDKQWNYVSSENKNAVVYANLKPNSYEFKAQVKNSVSHWSTSSGNLIRFKITPYFYQKTWFISLVGAVLILLYYLNDYFRNLRYKKETDKLSKLVEEKTESLKQIQKRELQREQESRMILNTEIEIKSKELEQQMLLILDKEKQLQETQKMEVVGQLTSGIAHDFNNMLSVIFIGSEVIRKDLEKNGSEQYENLKWLNNILLTAENCKEVIGQLLNFTRKDNDKSQTFCVYDALSDILSLIKIGIPNAIKFNMNFSTEPAFINADLSQFNQIILNLIINARNACGDYGEITITTGVIENKNSDSCVSCQQHLQDYYLEIVISDTGVGIHKDLLEHIFKPFFSTNSDAESTGIGLHIVNTNVHKMNGHIHVLPNDNKGMSFIVLLPLVKHKSMEPVIAARLSSNKNKPKKVLLVEDSSSLVELIALIFEENNISYDVGKNGLEGVDLFFQNPDKYDLVLTDNSMPELNGIDMSKYILSEFPDTNIVLLTGDINDTVVHECDKIGVCEIFLKPIKSDELVKLVNSYTKK